VTLIEEGDLFGGISRTEEYGGNRMDIGGHRFFSKDARVTGWWATMLSPQGMPSKDDLLLGRDRDLTPGGADPEAEDGVMLVRERFSRIYYKGKFFDYPVTLGFGTMRKMGLLTTLKAGFSYLKACVRKRPERSLEDFYINRFGKVLYAMFFKGYTRKLWGREPAGISAEWGAQRVKGLSVMAVVRDVVGKAFPRRRRAVETSLIRRFHYPKYGPGQLWSAAADKVARLGGEIRMGVRAVRIVRGEGGEVTGVECSDGSTVGCDCLISSMPVKDLVGAMAEVPEDVARIAAGLPYRDFQTVGVLVRSGSFLLRGDGKAAAVGGMTPDCWIYVQDASVGMGRIQVFNNWSPYLLNDFVGEVWLGLEYFCDEGDAMWDMGDDEFIGMAASELVAIGALASKDDILEAHRLRVRKAYPAYFGTYSEFGKVRAFLEGIGNLYCVGRNGQHRYNNMDHSMLTAFEAVDHIKGVSADKGRVWEVNAESEYHEGAKPPAKAGR